MNSIKIKRILAFFVDYMFLALFLSMIGQLEFLNPYYDRYYEEYEKYVETTDNLNYENANEILFSEEFEQNYYNLDKYGLVINIISIVCYLFYFVGFQKWNKGQTLGKKLFNIKVISNTDKPVSWGQYFLRTAILYNVIFDILIIISIFIFGIHKYKIFKLVISFISYIVFYLNVSFILFKADCRGLHDSLAGTKVVSCC